jgi:hypothetical protein
MNRRLFITLLGGGDVAAGRAGAAVSEEIPTIGYRGGSGPTGRRANARIFC